MFEREVVLVDGGAGSPVRAVLRRGLPAGVLVEVEEVWGPARHAAAARVPAEHGHWNWLNKVGWVQSGYLALSGVWVGDDCQGLSACRARPQPARAEPGQVVYLDYLEVAPWNYPPFHDPPRYRAVGSHLLADAVRVSREGGYGGRVGLHSLPGAYGFYERAGMSNLGPDPMYHYLVYFEFTADAAVEFMLRAGGR